VCLLPVNWLKKNVAPVSNQVDIYALVSVSSGFAALPDKQVC